MMMLSVVHGFRSRINGNAEVSATGPTSRVNVASSASSGHLGATVPRPRSFLGLAPPLATSADDTLGAWPESGAGLREGDGDDVR